jgi:hypothetical protein
MTAFFTLVFWNKELKEYLGLSEKSKEDAAS